MGSTRRLSSISRSLFLNIVVQLLTVIAVFVVTAYWLLLLPVLRDVAHQQTLQTGQRVESELNRLFLQVESTLKIAKQWGINGELNFLDNIEHFNQLFIPVLEQTSQISSVLLANDGGKRIFTTT